MEFSFLDKTQKERWLPVLFDLLYENMRSIAPSGCSYEQEKKNWLCEVSPALDKAPRQIILCLDHGEVLGYVQYYTRGPMIMVEEIQLKQRCRSTFLFYWLCKYLMSVLPADLETVEAYADRRNCSSIALMEKLGMKFCENIPDSTFVHMAGELENIRLWRCR